jgi:glycosyltransferase involved in cell wall biosynthesis
LETFPHLSGPLVTSPAAVDIRVLEQPYQDRAWDVVVAGAKNPNVARSVADIISRAGASVKCLDARLPRRDYLHQVSSGKVLVALPYSSGEFAFLTALEGMHLGAAVVMPRTFGTNGYCIDQRSCVLTSYDPGALCDACIDLLQRPQLIDQLRIEGRHIARLHSLQAERRRFHDIIAHMTKTRLDLNEMANGIR